MNLQRLRAAKAREGRLGETPNLIHHGRLLWTIGGCSKRGTLHGMTIERTTEKMMLFRNMERIPHGHLGARKIDQLAFEPRAQNLGR